jgi:uncharacterized protein YkwD
VRPALRLSPLPATATPSPADAPAQPSPFPTAEPSPGTDAAPPNPPPAEAPADGEAQLLALIHDLRASHGLAPYEHAPELSAVARAHSCDLAAHGAISHTSSDGRTLQDRLAAHMPPYVWPSESIAAGVDDPAQVIALWLDEPPEGWHRRNLLDPEQHVVGVGYCAAPDDPAGNRHYWTMVVARRAG